MVSIENVFKKYLDGSRDMSVIPRILLTGFDPFNDLTVNTSQAIVESIKGKSIESLHIYTHVIPTSYQRSFPILLNLIEQLDPNAILMLGVAPDISRFSIELQATNRVSTQDIDNDSYAPQDSVIEKGQPNCLRTTLDPNRFHFNLKLQNIDANLSHDCGSYVCNYIYYETLKFIKDRNQSTKVLFVHVPNIDDKQSTKEFGISLKSLSRDVIKMVYAIAEQIRDELDY